MSGLDLNNPDILADLERMVSELPDDDRAALDELIVPELESAWLPNPGPQTLAYESEADLLLYGGAAGGGKTDLLIGLGATKHQSSVIFRREGVELDGIVERSRELLEGAGRYNGSDMNWSLDDGRRIKFGGMREVKHWRKHAGKASDLMGLMKQVSSPKSTPRSG